MAISGMHGRSARTVGAHGPAIFVSIMALLGTWLVTATHAQADGPTTFSNTAAIAIPATGSANQTGPASPYPSDITVSGMAGSVSAVTVTFNNLTHSTLNDVDAMLVSPSGANLVVLSDIGDPNTLAFTNNATLTFSDSAAGPVPSGNVPSGTYRPTNTGGAESFPAPAPSPSTQSTLAGAFTGINPNGTWRLFIVDDATGDTGSMAGGWSLTVTTEVAAVATTTSVTTSVSPSTTGNPVTFTATVRAGGSVVTAGSVQFSDGGASLGAPVALNGSGMASLTTSALTEGTHEIRATYGGATGFLTSNGTISQRVDNQTVVNGDTFCNPGAVAISPLGPAQPYPSNINVSGLTGPVTKVTATLNGLSHQVPVDLDVMLSGPQPTTNLVLLSDAGGNAAVNNLNVTFDDDAAGTVPSPLVSGSFRPTDDDSDGGSDAFPAPAPAPSGATALSTFDGANPNGTWSLWVNDDASGDSGSVTGGWCLTVTTSLPTTTTLTSGLNPSEFGDPVTLTATVTSGGSPVSAGSVQFSDGGTTLGGSVALAADGTATLTTSALTVGTHSIQATYSGPGFESSSGNLNQVVQRAPTSTVLTSDINPSTAGQAVTFTATVTEGGTPVSAGSVQFSDGGTTLGGPVALAADGTATLTTAALTVGTHPITADYSGTANLAESSADLDQVVQARATTTTLTSDINPSTAGQAVTFTATVTEGGTPVSAGSVQFSDGGTTLGGPVALAADGTATLTTAALTVGTHPITADYSGTANLAESSADLDQVVQARATTTTLTSDINPSTAGQAVTFTATVTEGGTPVSAGSVQFSDGGTTLGGPVALAADGTATLTTAALTVGTHPITADYSGTANLAESSADLDQVVQARTTTTTLTSDINPSTGGQAVTFTATVTEGGTPVSAGSVQFSDGGTTLGGPVALAADGTATLTTAALTVGTHPITADYSGTANLAESSADLDQVVQAIPTTTSVTSSMNPSTVGQLVTFTATVTSVGNPVTTGTVAFSVDGTIVQASSDLNASGEATYSTTALTVGSHIIGAAYSGDATHPASDGSLDQTVGLVADAGGPYTVSEGTDLTLDGSGSTPGATYGWDLNDDGDFSDATGPSPILDWSDLEALGIDDGPSSHPVLLRVSLDSETVTSAATALNVTNTAPTAVITGDLTAAVSEPFTVKVGADDPSSADMAATFTYTIDWGDGSPLETVPGPADPPVTHAYSTAGTMSATFTATDKDGAGSGPTEVQVQVEPADDGSVPPDDDDSPAVTGAYPGVGTALGMLLVLGGTVLLFVARRRRLGTFREP